MASLRHSHGDPLIGGCRAGDANETEHHLITRPHRASKKRQLVARRIGEDSFKHKTFALLEEALPQRTGHFRRAISVKVSVLERGLPGSV